KAVIHGQMQIIVVACCFGGLCLHITTVKAQVDNTGLSNATFTIILASVQALQTHIISPLLHSST
ncbi:MAG: hypothetical protein ACKPKO_46435, partial [Candidatus Fonsibacter sp.]